MAKELRNMTVPLQKAAVLRMPYIEHVLVEETVFPLRV
jgi:hypothetical protein